ncbi:MAG: hypothetical protein ACM31L_13565 [Actinomycetota bacterium]
MLTGLLTPEGRALLDAVMKNVPSGLTLATAPGCTILRVSDFGSRLLQRPRERLEGISVEAHPDAYRVLDPATGEPAPPTDLPLARAAIYGETVTNREMIVVAEDGEKIPVLCNAGPIRSPAGELGSGLI